MRISDGMMEARTRRGVEARASFVDNLRRVCWFVGDASVAPNAAHMFGGPHIVAMREGRIWGIVWRWEPPSIRPAEGVPSLDGHSYFRVAKDDVSRLIAWSAHEETDRKGASIRAAYVFGDATGYWVYDHESLIAPQREEQNIADHIAVRRDRCARAGAFPW